VLFAAPVNVLDHTRHKRGGGYRVKRPAIWFHHLAAERRGWSSAGSSTLSTFAVFRFATGASWFQGGGRSIPEPETQARRPQFRYPYRTYV
jgi:hypothetical protein